MQNYDINTHVYPYKLHVQHMCIGSRESFLRQIVPRGISPRVLCAVVAVLRLLSHLETKQGYTWFRTRSSLLYSTSPIKVSKRRLVLTPIMSKYHHADIVLNDVVNGHGVVSVRVVGEDVRGYLQTYSSKNCNRYSFLRVLITWYFFT